MGFSFPSLPSLLISYFCDIIRSFLSFVALELIVKVETFYNSNSK